MYSAGFEIATDTVANATKAFLLSTKKFLFTRHFGDYIYFIFIYIYPDLHTECT